MCSVYQPIGADTVNGVSCRRRGRSLTASPLRWSSMPPPQWGRWRGANTHLASSSWVCASVVPPLWPGGLQCASRRQVPCCAANPMMAYCWLYGVVNTLRDDIYCKLFGCNPRFHVPAAPTFATGRLHLSSTETLNTWMPWYITSCEPCQLPPVCIRQYTGIAHS